MKTIAVVCLLLGTLLAQTSGRQDVPVTEVAGESWLNHLHRALDETSMGKTGRLGPPTLAAAKENTREYPSVLLESTDRSVIVHGSDLYRLNCQGCHGEFGAGAPPEINSVINPTRATSIAMTIARMRKLGMSMSRADAAQLANQSKAALLLRLHQGGTDMPPFAHLSETEVRAIYGYLKLLAGVPGAQNQQISIAERPVRIGEQIVKSTCHICHSAAGPNPNPEQLMDGVIPPLSSLTTRASLPEFERKIRNGAPIMMGSPLVAYRGRMPVFYYLTETEVADAYLYLKQYPPYQFAVLSPAQPIAETNQASMGSLPLTASADQVRSTHSSVAPESFLSWTVVAEIFVGLLMIGGLSYTWLEVRRIAGQKHRLRLVTAAAAPIEESSSAFEELPPLPPQFADELAPEGEPAIDVSRRVADHRLFESSWLSRHLDDKHWVA